MRILALVPDAFGGRGGIAQYQRDLITAMASSPSCSEIVCVARSATEAVSRIPEKVSFQFEKGGKLRYSIKVLRHAATHRDYDIVICGLINLLPLVALVQKITGGRLVLCVYGIDVWQPHSSWIVRKLLTRVDAIASISQLTLSKLNEWAPINSANTFVIPNAIDLDRHEVGPKDPALITRYGLEGKTVLYTLARLCANERYKGVDEILDALPELIDKNSNFFYIIAGDGTDRARLERKAKGLGLEDHTLFTGYLPEDEKDAHFRLADVFVMPSRGEGFGFVFLESLACGVPVISGNQDGGREALRNGMLGELVTPGDSDALFEAIAKSLQKKRVVPTGLRYFAFENFEARVHALLDKVRTKP